MCLCVVRNNSNYLLFRVELTAVLKSASDWWFSIASSASDKKNQNPHPVCGTGGGVDFRVGKISQNFGALCTVVRTAVLGIHRGHTKKPFRICCCRPCEQEMARIAENLRGEDFSTNPKNDILPCQNTPRSMTAVPSVPPGPSSPRSGENNHDRLARACPHLHLASRGELLRELRQVHGLEVGGVLLGRQLHVRLPVPTRQHAPPERCACLVEGLQDWGFDPMLRVCRVLDEEVDIAGRIRHRVLQLVIQYTVRHPRRLEGGVQCGLEVRWGEVRGGGVRWGEVRGGDGRRGKVR